MPCSIDEWVASPVAARLVGLFAAGKLDNLYLGGFGLIISAWQMGCDSAQVGFGVRCSPDRTHYRQRPGRRSLSMRYLHTAGTTPQWDKQRGDKHSTEIFSVVWGKTCRLEMISSNLIFSCVRTTIDVKVPHCNCKERDISESLWPPSLRAQYTSHNWIRILWFINAGNRQRLISPSDEKVVQLKPEAEYRSRLNFHVRSYLIYKP